MHRGTLVRYNQRTSSVFSNLSSSTMFIVDRYEPENNWVFVFGVACPIQADLLEIAKCRENA